MTTRSKAHTLHNDLRPPGSARKPLILCAFAPDLQGGGVKSHFIAAKALTAAIQHRGAHILSPFTPLYLLYE